MTAGPRWAADPARTVRSVRARVEEGRATEVHVEGLRTVPGVVLRLAAGLLALGLLAMAAQGGTLVLAIAVPLVAGVVCAVLVVTRPAAGWAGGVVLAAGVLMLAGPARGVLAAAVLVLLVHAVVLAAALAARTAPRTRVEVDVLSEALRHAAPVQAGAQVLSVVAVLVSQVATAGGGGLGAADLWRAGALVGAAALVVLVLPADEA